jgi:hypothetical protein
MYFLNISLLLAASLVSTVHARHPVGAHHHHRRQYDNGTYPATSTAVVSPIPVSSVPMGTGVSSVEDAVTTKVTNATLTYTMGQGTSTTVVTTTILRTETLTRIQVSNSSGRASLTVLTLPDRPSMQPENPLMLWNQTRWNPTLTSTA